MNILSIVLKSLRLMIKKKIQSTNLNDFNKKTLIKFYPKEFEILITPIIYLN